MGTAPTASVADRFGRLAPLSGTSRRIDPCAILLPIDCGRYQQTVEPGEYLRIIPAALQKANQDIRVKDKQFHFQAPSSTLEKSA